MNLHLNEDQRLLQEAFAKLFGNESTPARVRAAEPAGFDPALWAKCVEMGIPLMRVPESRGGGGLALMDAVLLAEQAGRHLASAPVAETVVAAHLLAQSADAAVQHWLTRLGEGSAIVTLALAPASVGSPQLVPAAGIAHAVLCLLEERLLLIPQVPPGPVPNLGALPLAAWRLPSDTAGTIELAQGAAACSAYSAAVDEWKLLGAAQMAAAARKALDDAAAYSCERKAFDRPIGGYQGLAHPLADSATEVDGARLLVWRAASLASRAPERAAAAVSKAWWWASESAGRATVRAMRTFGGYGMTLEYDAQLYFRRVRSLALLPGNPAHELSRLADRLWPSSPVAAAPAISDAGESGIDFDYGAAAADYAHQAQAFFASHASGREDFAFHSVDGHDPEVHRALAQAGLLYPDWPKRHGGAGRSPYETAALRAAFAQARWPTSVILVSDMVGKMLMAFGSPEAQQELLPALLAGKATGALGYTEPSCGSDIFAAKTRAVKDGDDWVIDGQKMFTSQGHIADHVLLLARTDPDAPKYAGLTLFIVPVDRPGYVVQEVKTLGNERTNITYYEGLRVPDRYRVGEVNGGVKAMSAALTMEQSAGDFFVAELIAMTGHAERWAGVPDETGTRPIEREEVRRGLAKAHAMLDVADVLSRRCVWAAAEQVAGKHHGPMAKLFASEALVSVSSELMALTAPVSLLRDSSELGHLELQARKAIQATIYGGTSEVQRSLIAEAALGMPRTRS